MNHKDKRTPLVGKSISSPYYKSMVNAEKLPVIKASVHYTFEKRYYYTFEKRYYVFHPALGLSVCVCVCLSVCHHVCGEMAGLSNMVLSEVNTIYTNLKMQH